MNKKASVFLASLLFASPIYANNFETMMNIYNNPKSAPKAKMCKGNAYCNAFVALSKQWQNIPNNYRYKGQYDIKASARKGVTYDSQGRNIGLHSGFSFYAPRSNQIINSAENINHLVNNEGALAVLLYIEDKNGWAE